MRRTLCHCSPAYGAIMHALPRDASALKRMTEKQMVDQAAPWVNRVPPQTEVKLHAWVAKSINPTATGLSDLGDLSELEGIGKKLKKIAKKIVKAPVKLVKAQVKIVKKAAKSKVMKKIARPLAYAVGAVTGTIGVVAKADQIRNAALKAKAKMKAQAAEYGINSESEQSAQQPAAIYQEQPSFATEQAFAPQYQTQQTFAPVQYPANVTPIREEQSFVSTQQAQSQANNYGSPIQRLQPADEQEEQPKIVGISMAGIMESMKTNPIPWTVGGLGLGFVLYRALNNHPSQRQSAY